MPSRLHGKTIRTLYSELLPYELAHNIAQAVYLSWQEWEDTHMAGILFGAGLAGVENKGCLSDWLTGIAECAQVGIGIIKGIHWRCLPIAGQAIFSIEDQ